VRVRRAHADDVQAMMALERVSPTAAHWSRQRYEDLFRASPEPSGRMAWVVENGDEAQPENTMRGAPEIFAFLVAHCLAGEWELENIVVDTAARRKGIATRLLCELIAHARIESCKHIFLEVRQSNQSARALYEKLGFEQAGVRKNYYADPTEDAILYRLNLP
jgi:[ribosomal protein S18]-alanine N-acetyltransferase